MPTKMFNRQFEALVRDSGVGVTHAVEVGAFNVAYCNLGHYLNDTSIRIQLFEPMPKMFAELVAANAGRKHVTCHNVAIMDEDGPVVMLDKWAGAHVVGIAAPEVVNLHTKSAKGFRGKTIPEVTVEGRVFGPYDDGTIDILTLDMEGCEWFVLKNMSSRPKWISVEMGDHHNPYKNPFSAEINEWMDSHGYKKHGTIVDRDTIWSRLSAG